MDWLRKEHFEECQDSLKGKKQLDIEMWIITVKMEN